MTEDFAVGGARFDGLMGVVEEARRECLSAELILDQVEGGLGQAALHIARGWRLLAALSARAAGKEGQPTDLKDFSAVESALDMRDLGGLSLKDRRRLTESGPRVFALAEAYAANLLAAPEDVKVRDLERQAIYLDSAVYRASLRVRRAFGKLFRQRLRRHAITIMTVLIAAILLGYVAPSLIYSSWDPRFWGAGPTHGFIIGAAEQGWGTLRYDRSVGDAPLQIGSRSFSTGLGTHAVSRIEIKFLSKWHTLSGACGLQAEAGGSIECRIEDEKGKILFQSPTLVAGSEAVPFSIPISGRNRLFLIGTDGGDGIAADHIDWVDLRFE